MVYDSILCKYKEQLKRVYRWYERFKRINKGTFPTKSVECYHDDVYAFFLNCYHLKDWIKQDSTVPKAASSIVEDFISKSPHLSICADLCNSIKHLSLIQSPRSGKTPQWIGRRIKQVSVGGVELSVAIKYSIDTAAGKMDAFNLATNCVQEWENFIKSNIP